MGLEIKVILHYCGFVAKQNTPTLAGVAKNGGAKPRKTANLKNPKPNANAKTNALTFLQPARGGGRGADVGGRFNAKTRRFTLPTRFNAKRVAVVVDGGVLYVGTSKLASQNAFAVHPTQHFLTLPTALVDGWTTCTLATCDKTLNALDGCVAYTLPTAGA